MLSFRNPDAVIAGNLHAYLPVWSMSLRFIVALVDIGCLRLGILLPFVSYFPSISIESG